MKSKKENNTNNLDKISELEFDTKSFNIDDYLSPHYSLMSSIQQHYFIHSNKNREITLDDLKYVVPYMHCDGMGFVENYYHFNDGIVVVHYDFKTKKQTIKYHDNYLNNFKFPINDKYEFKYKKEEK